MDVCAAAAKFAAGAAGAIAGAARTALQTLTFDDALMHHSLGAQTGFNAPQNTQHAAPTHTTDTSAPSHASATAGPTTTTHPPNHIPGTFPPSSPTAEHLVHISACAPPVWDPRYDLHWFDCCRVLGWHAALIFDAGVLRRLVDMGWLTLAELAAVPLAHAIYAREALVRIEDFAPRIVLDVPIPRRALREEMLGDPLMTASLRAGIAARAALAEAERARVRISPSAAWETEACVSWATEQRPTQARSTGERDLSTGSPSPRIIPGAGMDDDDNESGHSRRSKRRRHESENEEEDQDNAPEAKRHRRTRTSEPSRHAPSSSSSRASGSHSHTIPARQRRYRATTRSRPAPLRRHESLIYIHAPASASTSWLWGRAGPPLRRRHSYTDGWTPAPLRRHDTRIWIPAPVRVVQHVPGPVFAPTPPPTPTATPAEAQDPAQAVPTPAPNALRRHESYVLERWVSRKPSSM